MALAGAFERHAAGVVSDLCDLFDLLRSERVALGEFGELLEQIGFGEIEINDRNAWYAQNILQELATLQGENYKRLVAQHGEEFAKQRLKSSSLKKVVVDQGLLRPGHIRAVRGSDW